MEADLFVSSEIERITLMGDDEEVLIVDLPTLYFTLQNLAAEDFFKLRSEEKLNISDPHFMPLFIDKDWSRNLMQFPTWR